MKRISIDVLRETAKKVTNEALKEYEIPEEFREHIYMEIQFDGDDRIFELLSSVPENATLISQTRVNSYTGEAKVERIFLKKIQKL
jgi:hypothetical protein